MKKNIIKYLLYSKFTKYFKYLKSFSLTEELISWAQGFVFYNKIYMSNNVNKLHYVQ